jgi:hypothetical protein
MKTLATKFGRAPGRLRIDMLFLYAKADELFSDIFSGS